jgi:hypothetical protein
MTTYFVAKNGQDSDSFNGSQAQPWLTFNYAMTRISGGDWVIGDNGVYREGLNNVIPSGSPGNPTVIKALNPKGVILQSPGRWYVIEITQPRSYIVIDGIDANGQDLQNPYGSYYIYADSGEVSYITLANGAARGTKRDLASEYGPVGIMFGGHNNPGGHHHLECLNMESFGHVNPTNTGPGDGYGIYLNCHDSLIKGNRFFDNGGFQLHQYTSQGYGLDRNVITENFLDGSKQRGQAAAILAGGDSTHFFKNYIIGSAVPGQAGVDVYNGETNAVIENNVIRGSAGPPVRIYPGVFGTKAINNQFADNNPDAVEDNGTGSVIYGNTVGGVIPPPDPIPPVEKKTKKIKFQASLNIQLQGEITVEEFGPSSTLAATPTLSSPQSQGSKS